MKLTKIALAGLLMLCTRLWTQETTVVQAGSPTVGGTTANGVAAVGADRSNDLAGKTDLAGRTDVANQASAMQADGHGTGQASGQANGQDTVQQNGQPAFITSGLAPGDLITVHMFDFPDVGVVQVHVGTDGMIHLPYAGAVRVSGLLPDDVQKAIVEALKSRGIVKDPIVTVETLTAVNLNVTIIGQVASPRSIPLYAPAPLSYVLGQVGGITGLASPHLTIIHNNDQAPTPVDWAPDKLNAAVLNTTIIPGDIINVSNRGVYFIEGEINRPGIYPLGGILSVGTATATSGTGFLKEITLLQALAQAGGITPIAARSKMHILRTSDGKREDIVVDQVKLSNGEVADPILHPNDIIYLPSSYLRQQTNNLFSTALSGLYAATSIKANGFY